MVIPDKQVEEFKRLPTALEDLLHKIPTHDSTHDRPAPRPRAPHERAPDVLLRFNV